MRQVSFIGLKPMLALFSALFILIVGQAQPGRKIDWARDTISKADAIGGKNTFLNTVRGSGQNATEKIILPVDKLKDVMDACDANNIDNVAVMIITIRQSDIARFRKNHPEYTGTDAQLKGSQMLVFKVPRRAFGGAAGGKIKLSKNNPVMLSMLGAGLVVLNEPYADLPFADDVYLSFGNICPPPTSCDD